jgi:hypothetical protein
MAKLSTEHLTEEVRKLTEVLAWSIERNAPKAHIYCTTCGHGIEHHDQVDDSCRFPKSLGAPHKLCQCARFTMPEAFLDEPPT